MNHFLALRLADQTRDQLGCIATRLQTWGLPAAWVEPDDLHLTVLFLGDLSDNERQWLPTMIDQVASSQRRPQLTLPGLGAWGGHSAPKTVFAAIADAEESCKAMHQELAEAIDMAVDGNYRPHITICRPRPLAPHEAANLPRHATWPQLLESFGQATWGDCLVDSLVWYVSDPHPRRTCRYNELARWPLIPR